LAQRLRFVVEGQLAHFGDEVEETMMSESVVECFDMLFEEVGAPCILGRQTANVFGSAFASAFALQALFPQQTRVA
jgi:hypothetical protein